MHKTKKKKKKKKKNHSVSIEKEIKKVDKNGNDDIFTILCKIKFIDSAGFQASSLSTIFDNLAKGIHKIRCKVCNCFFQYNNVKDNLIKDKCLSCNKECLNKVNEEIKKPLKTYLSFGLWYQWIYSVDEKRAWITVKNLMKCHCLKKEIFTIKKSW